MHAVALDHGSQSCITVLAMPRTLARSAWGPTTDARFGRGKGRPPALFAACTHVSRIVPRARGKVRGEPAEKTTMAVCRSLSEGRRSGILAGSHVVAPGRRGQSKPVIAAVAAVASATGGEGAIRCQPRQTAVTALTLAA